MNGEYPTNASSGVRSRTVNHLPFRSPNGLRNAILATAAIQILLNMGVGIQILHLLGLFGQVAEHGVSYELQSAMHDGGRRQLLLNGAQSIVFLAGCVLGGLWIHRVAGNARALGAHGLSDSPGWAVGWYFVPLANLVRPYRAMQEIWQASLSPSRWKRVSTHPLLGVWWAVFVTAAIYGTLVAFQQSTAGTIDALRTQELMTLWLQPLAMAATGLFAAIVSRISSMQCEEHFRQGMRPAPIEGMAALA